MVSAVVGHGASYRIHLILGVIRDVAVEDLWLFSGGGTVPLGLDVIWTAMLPKSSYMMMPTGSPPIGDSRGPTPLIQTSLRSTRAPRSQRSPQAQCCAAAGIAPIRSAPQTRSIYFIRRPPVRVRSLTIELGRKNRRYLSAAASCYVFAY